MKSFEAQEAFSEEFEAKSLDSIATSIELKSDYKEKPKILISEKANNGFEILKKEFAAEKESKEPKVFAVVRCWNKDKNSLEGFAERIRKIKENIPGLAGVFVSINKEGDKGETLGNFEDLNFDGVPVLPVEIERYSWTSGLNAPIALINEFCLDNDIDRENIRIMNLSFDVDLEPEELKKTNEEIHRNDFVFTARKSSENKSPFEELHNGEALWDKFKNVLKDPNSADLSELSYIFRNTFNVIKLTDLVELGGFNPLCNGDVRKFSPADPRPDYFYHYNSQDVKVSIKGMEDSEFFMRLILKSLKDKKISKIKELHDAFENPVLYTDQSWNNLEELKKIKKISNEMVALSLIISGVATKEHISTPEENKTVGLVNQFYLPKSMQDFYIRK